MKEKKGFLYFKERKLLFSLCFSFLLLISIFSFIFYNNFVIAQENNNLKYSNNDLTFELLSTSNYYSYLGIDKTIIKGTLTSHKSVNEIKQVGLGYQLVMEYDIEIPTQTIGGVIGDISFINRENYQETEKDYYIAYKREINALKDICLEWTENENKTQICSKYGTEPYTYYVWERYNSKDLIKGNITLGLFVYNNEGDYFDGIWDFGGLGITKHAEWNASFTAGLVAYYSMDDNLATTNVIDSLGNYDGTLAGGDNTDDLSSAGKIGTSLLLNGADDYINLDTLLGGISSNTQGTWTAWVKPVDATPTGSGVIFEAGDTNVNEFLNLYNDASSDLRSQLYDAGTRHIYIDTPSGAFKDGQWSFIAIVQNGTSPMLYVNGTAQTLTYQDQSDLTLWMSALAGVDNFRIGCANHNNGGNTAFFNGNIDEVGIWNRSLTAEEILYLWNDGDGVSYEVEIPELKTDIETWEDLYNIRYYPYENYTLLNDLNASIEDYDIYACEGCDTKNPVGFTGSGFAPIGIGGEQFNGTFNGNYKTIKDFWQDSSVVGGGLFGNTTDASIYTLYISNATMYNVHDYGGILAGWMYNTNLNVIYIYNSTTLFEGTSGIMGGYFRNGTASSVRIYNSIIDSSLGAEKIGGLFGHIRDSEIISSNLINISVCSDSPLLCSDGVGGFAGESEDSFYTISVSITNSRIKGIDEVGGLIGYSINDEIIGSYVSFNNITSTGNRVGGAVGYLDESYLRRVFTTTNKINSTGYHIGGIAGDMIDYCDGRVNVGIYNSYASGNYITGQHSVGGLAGTIDRDYCAGNYDINILLKDSLSSSNYISAEYEVGGAVGYIVWTGGSYEICNGIENVFSWTSWITATDPDPEIGGLIGGTSCEPSIVSFSSFWDETLFPTDNGIGIGITTTQAKTLSTYVNPGWIITPVYGAITSYPYILEGIGQWVIQQITPEGNIPELIESFPNLTLCLNDTGIINFNDYFYQMENLDDYLWELRYYNEDTGYNYVYKSKFPYNTYTLTGNISGEIENVMSFTLVQDTGTLVFDNLGYIFDNPLSNIFRIGVTAFNSYGSAEETYFYITLNESSCFIPPTPPEDETIITGWFGYIVNWFLDFFPDSDDLSASQKVGIIIISMILITTLLLLVTYNSITGIPTAVVYLTGFINFMLLIFFISIGYIPIIVVILLTLIIFILAYFRVRGGSNGGS